MENIKLEYHKVVDILIFNKLGELALQKRVLDDKPFPGYWDFSAGGHIDLGEESQNAAERELFEELGISPSLVFIKKEIFYYPAWNSKISREVNADIYKAVYDGELKINLKEVEKVVFFDLPVIQKMIDKREEIHPEFLLAWEKGIIGSIKGN